MIDSESGLTALDRLTRTAAVAVSRRTILKGGLGGIGAALGLQFFNLRPVEAQECGNCNTCYGRCTTGTSSTYCCSPNGLYCYYDSCVGCWCHQARLQVCDCNNWGASCPGCCFLCLFGCPC